MIQFITCVTLSTSIFIYLSYKSRQSCRINTPNLLHVYLNPKYAEVRLIIDALGLSNLYVFFYFKHTVYACLSGVSCNYICDKINFDMSF